MFWNLHSTMVGWSGVSPHLPCFCLTFDRVLAQSLVWGGASPHPAMVAGLFCSGYCFLRSCSETEMILSGGCCLWWLLLSTVCHSISISLAFLDPYMWECPLDAWERDVSWGCCCCLVPCAVHYRGPVRDVVPQLDVNGCSFSFGPMCYGLGAVRFCVLFPCFRWGLHPSAVSLTSLSCFSVSFL